MAVEWSRDPMTS